MFRGVTSLIPGALLDQILMTGVSRAPAHHIGGLALAGISSLLFAASIVYGAMSLSDALKDHYTPDQVHVFMALTLAACSIVTGVIAYCVHQCKKSRLEKLRSEAAEKISSVVETVMKDLDDPIRNNPKMAVAIATILGFVIAERVL